MRVEDLVDAFGLFMKTVRGDNNISSDSFLVLLRLIIPQEGFGSLKQLNANLWLVSKSTKNKTLITSFSFKGKEEEGLLSLLELKLLLFLFDLINNKDKFNNILNN